MVLGGSEEGGTERLKNVLLAQLFLSYTKQIRHESTEVRLSPFFSVFDCHPSLSMCPVRSGGGWNSKHEPFSVRLAKNVCSQVEHRSLCCFRSFYKLKAVSSKLMFLVGCWTSTFTFTDCAKFSANTTRKKY